MIESSGRKPGCPARGASRCLPSRARGDERPRRWCALPRHHSERSQLAGGARGDGRGACRRWTTRARVAVTPSSPSARRAITRWRHGGWGSAWSTTSSSRLATPSARGLARVLIVDWDVHHGNGTQALVETDATIRFVSLHQHPWYPGTGMADERGVGNVFNVPRGPGKPPALYVNDLWAAVVAATTDWTPDLVLVSAGFDAMLGDPLGGFTLEPEHYAVLTHTAARAPSRGAYRRPARGRLRADANRRRRVGAHRGAGVAGGHPGAETAGATIVIPSGARDLLRQILRSLRSVRMTSQLCDLLRGPRDSVSPDGSRMSGAPYPASLHHRAGRAERLPHGLGAPDATATATRAGARPRRPSSTARRPSPCSPRSSCTRTALPADPFDIEETERRWEIMLRREPRGARGALLRAARPRRQAARHSGLPALGPRSREGAAVHLHHRTRHAGEDPGEGAGGRAVSDPQDQAGDRSG